MPNVIVIAGPNGAGKSTSAPTLVRDTLKIFEYVNADTIAQGLSAYAPESAALTAGRIMRSRMHDLATQNVDFAFETTLSTKSYARWLKQLQSINKYFVHVVFLWLESPELAIKRVAARVKDGGHDIPIPTILRRYERGMKNFFQIYRPLADSWQMLDASDADPVEVAFGAKISEEEVVVDEVLWKKIKRSN